MTYVSPIILSKLEWSMSESVRGGTVATDETANLISADKVTGTSVYNPQGENLGSIYDVMINKVSGQVAYAVMSFGGFLAWGRAITLCRGGL